MSSSASASSRSSDSGARTLRGSLFVAAGCVCFVAFAYAAVVSKLLPPSDNAVVAAVQNDRYYCFLVPLTLPILVVAVYFHWLSMKLFKHA
ncbi:hypothetical protein EUGRSUZ_J00742 [Eucalyptus grandis]|uniref:Phosphatidylinositol N-acetylglucosaminyltransferase subunit Y n=2 Tax=Eucalyptus grandis TaxID=71139 RepID=A0A059ABM5_EUCGR|nr:hypothetical protein EUGRSUZ_J00742 [Eucalyptus grandis]